VASILFAAGVCQCYGGGWLKEVVFPKRSCFGVDGCCWSLCRCSIVWAIDNNMVAVQARFDFCFRFVHGAVDLCTEEYISKQMVP